MRTQTLLVALLAALASTSAYSAPDAPKPNVRTVTAFVNLDRSRYEAQIDETMKVLNAAKAEFSKRGYETQRVEVEQATLGAPATGQRQEDR